MVAAVLAAAWCIVNHCGTIPDLDFGCGQYYYTDIPGWEKYFSVRGVTDGLPRALYYVLFAVWGVLMYRVWLWLDWRGDRAVQKETVGAAAGAPAAFPLFLLPDSGPCLVVGSGKVAARKAAILRDFGFTVETCAAEAFEETRLMPDCALVVAATRDATVNRRVAEGCRARRILVNVVDDPELCTFYFAAMERKGPVTVAVSTNGTCPVAGQILRDRIRPLLTENFVRTVERLGADRAQWKKNWPDPSARAAAQRKEFE